MVPAPGSYSRAGARRKQGAGDGSGVVLWALGAGSGRHGAQTARVLAAVEEVLVERRPYLVVVVGDVNSTLACSIVAKKMGIQVAHLNLLIQL